MSSYPQIQSPGFFPKLRELPNCLEPLAQLATSDRKLVAQIFLLIKNIDINTIEEDYSSSKVVTG